MDQRESTGTLSERQRFPSIDPDHNVDQNVHVMPSHPDDVISRRHRHG